MSTSVLIVGAGPTGLSAAAFLQRLGVPFRIIEKEKEPSPYSKALGIQSRTLEVYESLGLSETLIKSGHKVEGLTNYWLGEKLASIDFSHLESRYPYVLVLPQNQTVKILTNHLSNHGIEIEKEKELVSFEQNEDGVTGVLSLPTGKKEVIQADWLLACDGAHSTVRHGLNFSFIGDAMDHFFILADITTSLPVDDKQLHGFLDRDGILAFFPIGQNRWRMAANLPKAQIHGSLPDLTREELESVIFQRTKLLIKIDEVLWFSPFKINTRMAEEIRQNRIFLLGDAFHIHSPIGGQGMNTGIQDAHNLAWKLALVHEKKSPELLLQSYSYERKKNALKLLKFTEKTTHFMEGNSRTLQWIRNTLLPIAFSLFPSKITRAIAELDIDYSGSPIVAKGCGKRVASLLKYVNYERHVLLCSGKTPEEISPFVTKKLIEVHEVRGDCPYLLLRPDGYTAFKSQTIGPLLKYLNGLFIQ